MSFRSNKNTLCALAAAAALALAAPVQAKLVGSAFDPPLFDGVGTFLLPDVAACLGLSGGFHTVNGGSDPCTGVILLSAVGECVGRRGYRAPVAAAADSERDRGHRDRHRHGDAAARGRRQHRHDPDLRRRVHRRPLLLQLVDLSGIRVCPERGVPQQLGHPCSAQRCSEGTALRRIESVSAIPRPTSSSPQIPEPGSLALLIGALGAGWIVRRRSTAA